MKKLMMLLAAGIGFSFATVNAATTGATATTTKQHIHKTTVVAATPAKAVQPAVAKSATTVKVTPTPAKTNANGTVLKKGGTHDKRYKATANTQSRKKANDTADMRYKANQNPQTKK